MIRADSTNQRRLVGNPGLDRAPALSPNGKRLVWESHVSGVPNIWVVMKSTYFLDKDELLRHIESTTELQWTPPDR